MGLGLGVSVGCGVAAAVGNGGAEVAVGVVVGSLATAGKYTSIEGLHPDFGQYRR